MQAAQRVRELDAEQRRVEPAAIGEHEADAVAAPARERRLVRDEVGGLEAHARDVAPVQVRREPRAVDPRRAEELERRLAFRGRR